MSSTNRTIKVFIPFLKATMQVLQELTQEVFIKRNVYTHVGNLTGADYQVEIGIIGDIRSRVIFSFPKPFAKELTRIMLDISDEETDDETIEGSIKEIGNMVSGNAMGLLEEIGVDSDITPPKLYLPGAKLVGDQAQLGVLEFSSNIGSFQVAIVTNENNQFLKNDAIFCIGFPTETDELLARFFFPKGIYLIGCSSNNLLQMLENHKPSLILLNTQDPKIEEILSLLSQIKDMGQIHLALFGEKEISLPFLSTLTEEYSKDPYVVLESVKNVLSQVGLSIYDNRENIILNVPAHSKDSAFFLVKTRRGDLEQIPIMQLSFSSLTINIAEHQYINFPERKNLAKKNQPQIKLANKEIVHIEKAQIGKQMEDDVIVILLHHILETELSKITNYMYRILSFNK